jgi:hypothetical protein
VGSYSNTIASAFLHKNEDREGLVLLPFNISGSAHFNDVQLDGFFVRGTVVEQSSSVFIHLCLIPDAVLEIESAITYF